MSSTRVLDSVLLDKPASRATRLGATGSGGLVSVIQRLSQARSVPEIQAIVRTAARSLTGADGATFVLRDREQCFYADEDAIAPLWKGQRFPMSICVSGWVMRHSQPACIEDVYQDERIPHDAYRPTFVKSLAMVPIRRLDPIGAIGNYWADHHQATDAEVQLLQALADSVSVAIENGRVYQQLDDARRETMQRLALAAEYRDDGTHQHTARVARTAAAIARAIGLPASQVLLIGQAAPLHDVGKLAIPDAILLKPGKLTPAEFEQVKQHTTAGAAILAGSASEVLRLAEEVALTHHEWWNGHGYPAGLKGSAIPLSGRIVALADVFDALTHARPYKSRWTVEQALAEITRLKGRQFDPALVDAFNRLNPHAFVEIPTA